MLRLRLLWVVPRGNGGFELVMCKTLSEYPKPPSSKGVDEPVLVENDN